MELCRAPGAVRAFAKPICRVVHVENGRTVLHGTGAKHAHFNLISYSYSTSSRAHTLRVELRLGLWGELRYVRDEPDQELFSNTEG